MGNPLYEPLLVVATALVLAAMAWAVIHFLGESYFSVASSLLIVAVFAENLRLRGLLRRNGIAPNRLRGRER